MSNSSIFGFTELNLLVTGPQRSGTRIASTMIAKDQNRFYVDECDIGMKSLSKLLSFLQNDNRTVIQCPRLSCICHLIDFPNTAVIYMQRNTEDIIESQDRIKWEYEKAELDFYFRDCGISPKIKYEVWNKFQKKMMQVPFYELDYNYLKQHPFWVDKEHRKGFKWNQTNAGAPSSFSDRIGDCTKGQLKLKLFQ